MHVLVSGAGEVHESNNRNTKGIPVLIHTVYHLPINQQLCFSLFSCTTGEVSTLQPITGGVSL